MRETRANKRVCSSPVAGCAQGGSSDSLVSVPKGDAHLTGISPGTVSPGSPSSSRVSVETDTELFGSPQPPSSSSSCSPDSSPVRRSSYSVVSFEGSIRSLSTGQLAPGKPGVDQCLFASEGSVAAPSTGQPDAAISGVSRRLSGSEGSTQSPSNGQPAPGNPGVSQRPHGSVDSMGSPSAGQPGAATPSVPRCSSPAGSEGFTVVSHRRVPRSRAPFPIPRDPKAVTILAKPTEGSKPLSGVPSSRVHIALKDLGPFTAFRSIKGGGLAIDFEEGFDVSPLLASCTHLLGIAVLVSLPAAVRHRSGKIEDVYFGDTNDVILDAINEGGRGEYKVTRLQRLSKEGDMRPGPCKLVFEGSSLPPSVQFFGRIYPVSLFIPKALQCLRCCRWGHHKKTCHCPARCFICGGRHAHDPCCSFTISCANCKGPHRADAHACPFYSRELDVGRIKAMQDISFPDARRSLAESASSRSQPPSLLTSHIRSSGQSCGAGYMSYASVLAPAPATVSSSCIASCNGTLGSHTAPASGHLGVPPSLACAQAATGSSASPVATLVISPATGGKRRNKRNKKGGIAPGPQGSPPPIWLHPPPGFDAFPTARSVSQVPNAPPSDRTQLLRDLHALYTRLLGSYRGDVSLQHWITCSIGPLFLILSSPEVSVAAPFLGGPLVSSPCLNGQQA